MLQAILKNREKRAKKQKELLALYQKPIISISINIPGEKKLTKESLFIFEVMTNALKNALKDNFKELYFSKKKTGVESIICSEMSALELKKLTCKLEDETLLGRFVDFDVFDIDGKQLSRKNFGKQERKCFLCDKKAVVCARQRAHNIDELLGHISLHVKVYKKFQKISYFAKKAMKKEVDLTPKPGLVDKNDNGSHKDMDIHLFYKSIDAISSYFEKFLYIGFCENDIFLSLRKVGQECEKSMFDVTKGVNVHKGLIFSYAVILGALGYLIKNNQKINTHNLQITIQSICKDLVRNDLEAKEVKSAGHKYYKVSKNGGIRSEAQSGYETLFSKSLPFFINYKIKYNQTIALKYTLLYLISTLQDTTIFNRGGLEAMAFVQKEAKKALHVKPKELDDIMIKLNHIFIQKNLSPGGSADMLALTWFISKIIK